MKMKYTSKPATTVNGVSSNSSSMAATATVSVCIAQKNTEALRTCLHYNVELSKPQSLPSWACMRAWAMLHCLQPLLHAGSRVGLTT